MHMQEIQVELVEASIEFKGHGLVTGIVFFDFGTFQFPERDWNDAVVVVLGWWLSSLDSLLVGGATEVELRFMEGPPMLSIKKLSDDECLARCFGLPAVEEKAVFKCSALELLRSILKVATRVQRVCHLNGWRSADVDSLDGSIHAARRLTRKH